jgi:hypothetical protein
MRNTEKVRRSAASNLFVQFPLAELTLQLAVDPSKSRRSIPARADGQSHGRSQQKPTVDPSKNRRLIPTICSAQRTLHRTAWSRLFLLLLLLGVRGMVTKSGSVQFIFCSVSAVCLNLKNTRNGPVSCHLLLRRNLLCMLMRRWCRSEVDWTLLPSSIFWERYWGHRSRKAWIYRYTLRSHQVRSRSWHVRRHRLTKNLRRKKNQSLRVQTKFFWMMN